MKNIVLIGMPGSGKTTIGELIAKSLDLEFYDIDAIIEDKYKDTIANIFKKGEEYFRKIEFSVVKDISQVKSSIIATGGGVIKSEKNIKNLKKNGVIIFIDRKVEDIASDIDANKRPLINDVYNDIKNIYTQRIGLYREFCDISVDNIGDINKVCGKLINIVKDIK